MVRIRLSSRVEIHPEQVPLRGELPCILGRHPACQLQILHARISRRHCCVFVWNGRVWVHDLHSNYGSYLNGQRLDWPLPLQNADYLRLGPLSFQVFIEEDSHT